jgi:hypothetical protein
MQGICKGCIIQIDIKRMLPMDFIFFPLQFYDVATLTIVHKSNYPNLATC